jgi:hypothetical protein
MDCSGLPSGILKYFVKERPGLLPRGAVDTSCLVSVFAITRSAVKSVFMLAGLSGAWPAVVQGQDAADAPTAVQFDPGPLGLLGPVGSGQWYVLAEPETSLASRPEFERDRRLSVIALELRLGPMESEAFDAAHDPSVARQWCSLSWWRANGQCYRLWMLLDRWPTPHDDPGIAAYAWLEPGWPQPITYRHASSGRLLLPRLDLWRHGWPQTEAGPRSGALRRPLAGLPERLWLHGWPFRRAGLDEVPEGATSAAPRPPESPQELRLDPDLLIGWTSMDRDVAGRTSRLLPDGRYRYAAKTPDDLLADRDSGANFFVAHPRRGDDRLPDWLAASAMFTNTLARHAADWPADLYRPNYWGFGNHIDEPGVQNWGLELREAPDAPPPLEQAVRSLQRQVRDAVEARGGRSLQRHVGKRFGLGAMDLEEGPESIVTWEYEWPTAWYQLAVDPGVGGIVDEDAATGELVETYNMAFGTEIPPTVDNAVALRVAVLRGAARNFGKRWGVAFYHPNEVKLKSATIPLLYARGASYFWAWTGWVGITDNSGLPYPYQRYYNTLVRTAWQAAPHRDLEALLHAAKIAIVLPHGFTFTPYHMHRLPWLHLEKTGPTGVTPRRVLANAAQEAERLLRSGVDFDIAIDEPRFTRRGYDELVYVLADGRLRIERPQSAAPEWLEAPRPVHRPDLGPRPQLWLERIDTAAGDGTVRFRAVGRLGTGDWENEQESARVSWELYGPDDRVRPAVFPEHGAVWSLELDPDSTVRLEHPVPSAVLPTAGAGQDRLPRAGRYTLRAALCDVFGRPAITYQTFEVE